MDILKLHKTLEANGLPIKTITSGTDCGENGISKYFADFRLRLDFSRKLSKEEDTQVRDCVMTFGDSKTVDLVEEAAYTAIQKDPVWLKMSPEEAAAWIGESVQDIESAKAALVLIARVLKAVVDELHPDAR